MKSRRIVMSAALACFFLAMLFPLWGHLFPQPEVESLEEKRELTELNLSGPLKKQIKTLENYLDDHLAFRESAISAVLRANLALGESPNSVVIPGFDGWFFFNEGEEDFRNGTGLDRESLIELYDAQQRATDTFAAAGADYRIMIAPDKHSVYPRYLPLSHRLGSGPSMMEQMMTAPDDHYTVRFVNVLPALAAAAESESRQYYKTDSHWTSNGAWTAYQALADELIKDHPTIRRLTEDDLVHSEVSASGDLMSMIGQKGLITEQFDNVSLKAPASRPSPDREDTTVNEAIPDAPKLLVFTDSFGGAIAPFLRESFSEVTFVSNDSPSFAALGDLSRYDVVLMEIVERNRSWLWGGIREDTDDAEEEVFEE